MTLPTLSFIMDVFLRTERDTITNKNSLPQLRPPKRKLELKPMRIEKKPLLGP